MTVGSFDTKDTFVQFKKRNIESTTSKIENEDSSDAFNLSFIKTICDCCSCWFIDDTKHVDTSDLSCIFGRLSLSIIEICGTSNYCTGHLFTEIRFWNFLHLGKDHGWNLLSFKLFGFTLVFDNNNWFSIWTFFNFEWPKFDIALYWVILKLPTN